MKRNGPKAAIRGLWHDKQQLGTAPAYLTALRAAATLIVANNGQCLSSHVVLKPKVRSPHVQ
jgi:hypothetical protein